MGSRERAEQLSEKLAITSPFKKILRFALAKCGNCPNRITCWSQIFRDKGKLYEVYREIFFCDGVYKGDGKETSDGRQAIALLKECAPCEHLDVCIQCILISKDFIGLTDATSDDVLQHVEVVKACAGCLNNVACWSGKLKELGIGWTDKARLFYNIIFKCKFKEEGDEVDEN